MSAKMKRIIAIVLVSIAFLVLVPVLFYNIVSWKTADRVFDDIDKLPYNEVGMVLGTGPTLRSGKPNIYFTSRIDAAEALYKAGKIKYVLVSGDNSRKDYSEPDAMRDSLVNRGIPKEVIYLDYAGFRTLDSVVRGKEIFGQTKMTIISQRFHNERTIILGDWQEMELVGFNANVSIKRTYYIRNMIREGYARVKLYLDILVNKQPHFMGEAIEIGEGMPQEDVNR